MVGAAVVVVEGCGAVRGELSAACAQPATISAPTSRAVQGARLEGGMAVQGRGGPGPRCRADRFGPVTAQRHVVQVDVPLALVELATDVLWQGDPSAVSVEDRGSDGVRLVADVNDLEVLTRLPEGVSVAKLDPDSDDHLDAWRAWATPTPCRTPHRGRSGVAARADLAVR